MYWLRPGGLAEFLAAHGDGSSSQPKVYACLPLDFEQRQADEHMIESSKLYLIEHCMSFAALLAHRHPGAILCVILDPAEKPRDEVKSRMNALGFEDQALSLMNDLSKAKPEAIQVFLDAGVSFARGPGVQDFLKSRWQPQALLPETRWRARGIALL